MLCVPAPAPCQVWSHASMSSARILNKITLTNPFLPAQTLCISPVLTESTSTLVNRLPTTPRLAYLQFEQIVIF